MLTADYYIRTGYQKLQLEFNTFNKFQERINKPFGEMHLIFTNPYSTPLYTAKTQPQFTNLHII